MLPVKWESLRRGIEFWVQVMRMNDDRLVKVVMLEALEIGSKVKWLKDLQQSLEKLGWREAIREVARNHGYDRLKEEQLLAKL